MSARSSLLTILAIFISVATEACAEQPAITERVLSKSDVFYQDDSSFYRQVSHSPDGRWIAIVRDDEKDNIWASELVLFDNSTSTSRVVVPGDITMTYATYSAVAFGVWWDSSNVSIGISDGDVDSVNIVYDTESQRIVKKERNRSLDNQMVADGKSEDPTGLSAPISECFPDWDQDVITSAIDAAHTSWISRGQSALFQPRHVKADPILWLLNLQECTRTVLFDPGNSRLPTFLGWLSGAASYEERLAFALHGTRPTPGSNKSEQTGLLVIGSLSPDGPDSIEVSDLPSVKLVNAGQMGGFEYFLLRPTLDYCGGRLFAFNSQQVREIRVPNASFCDASANEPSGSLALVVRLGPDRKSPRRFMITKPPAGMTKAPNGAFIKQVARMIRS
jgi:hypothetical protein